MQQPAVILLVRFRHLPKEKVLRVAEDRAPKFRALTDLTQKYYLEASEGGEYAGLYLWESPTAMAEFAQSEVGAPVSRTRLRDGR